MQAVGDEAPEVAVGAVEELLDEGVRGWSGGAADARRPAVELDAEADEVDRDVRCQAWRDRVGRALDLDGSRGCEAAEAELLEERQEPALAGGAR